MVSLVQRLINKNELTQVVLKLLILTMSVMTIVT